MGLGLLGQDERMTRTGRQNLRGLTSLGEDAMPLAKVGRLRLDGGNLPRFLPCLTISASMSSMEPREQP
jgi:hypothetical protein